MIFWQILYATAMRFWKKESLLRASALTYYTLISLVPILAALIGVARGFGLDLLLEQTLLERFEEQSKLLQMALDFAHRALERSRGGVIAGFGVLLLFWSVTSMMASLEEALNRAWEVVNPRSWRRRLADYTALVLVLPLLLVGVSSITLLISTGNLIAIFVALLTWLLFAIIYAVVPNTQVRWWAALTAGFFAGSCFLALHWAYFHFQLIAASYGAVYGSFSALPLFLFWLQLSWMVLLAGAELGYSFQHPQSWRHQQQEHKSIRAQQLELLMVLHYCVRAFAQRKTPPTVGQLSQALSLPHRVASTATTQLQKLGLLSAVSSATSDGPQGFQPALPLKQLTIATVLNAIEGEPLQNKQATESSTELARCLEEVNSTRSESAANRRLEDIQGFE